MGTTTPDGVDLERLRPFFAAYVEGAQDAPLTATLIAGGRSNRKTNCGLERMAWTASRIPPSKFPLLRPEA